MGHIFVGTFLFYNNFCVCKIFFKPTQFCPLQGWEKSCKKTENNNKYLMPEVGKYDFWEVLYVPNDVGYLEFECSWKTCIFQVEMLPNPMANLIIVMCSLKLIVAIISLLSMYKYMSWLSKEIA